VHFIDVGVSLKKKKNGVIFFINVMVKCAKLKKKSNGKKNLYLKGMEIENIMVKYTNKKMND